MQTHYNACVGIVREITFGCNLDVDIQKIVNFLISTSSIEINKVELSESVSKFYNSFNLEKISRFFLALSNTELNKQNKLPLLLCCLAIPSDTNRDIMFLQATGINFKDEDYMNLLVYSMF